MIPTAILPVVRRAILDLVNDIGGEHNDDTLARLLTELGHRVARRDIADQLEWLGDQGLLIVGEVGAFRTARISSDGTDLAEGRLTVDGVHRHKTGE